MWSRKLLELSEMYVKWVRRREQWVRRREKWIRRREKCVTAKAEYLEKTEKHQRHDVVSVKVPCTYDGV